MTKNKLIEEWIIQADYDFKTAKAMFLAKRYIYAVFMCHLSLEKLFKGLYLKELKKIPPKAHDLLFLISEINLAVPEEKMEFLKILNNASIPTRYPEELKLLLKVYNRKRTEEVVHKTEGIFKWIKSLLRR